MPSIEDVYTYYLKAADLQAQPRTVTIEAATVEKIFDPKTKRNEPCVVLRFHGKKKVMALNKTQASSLAAITGTDDYTAWGKALIILTPTRHNNKDTIQITAAPIPANGQPAPNAPARRDPAEVIKELYPE